MNTTISAVSHSDALIPDRTRGSARDSDSHGLLTKLGTLAEALDDTFDRSASGSSEKFYQDHVNAIYIAIYTEVALGPLFGAITVYLYNH